MERICVEGWSIGAAAMLVCVVSGLTRLPSHDRLLPAMEWCCWELVCFGVIVQIALADGHGRHFSARLNHIGVIVI